MARRSTSHRVRLLKASRVMEPGGRTSSVATVARNVRSCMRILKAARL
jgi:hypothetical protein